MAFGSMLYKLLIGPLELLFEVIYSLAYRHLSNAGLAIIFLSLAVNLLVLPLYRRADALQKEEQDLEKKLKPWTAHINKTFSGDERYLMMQTFYRQNSYRPAYVLRSSVSLLLQIPFFMAAYNFLSGLMLLKGASFGPIRDLGAPDALLSAGGITLNVLPILMTLINFLSASVYMKGFPLKNKLMTYGMALVFLVLLYHSPSGLAFYWLLNNLFSLCKNIIYRIRFSAKGLRTCAAVLSAIGLIPLNAALIFRPDDPMRIKLFLTAGIFMLIAVIHFIGSRGYTLPFFTDIRTNPRLFITGCIFMTVFTGALIPSTIIRSAIGDFINIRAFYSPLWYTVSTLLLAAGTFVVWFGIFYRLAVPFGRKLMELGICILSVCSIINYMFFGTDRGVLSSYLQYETPPSDTVQQILVNIIILLEIIAFLYFIYTKKSSLVNSAVTVFCLAAAVMAVINTADTGKELRDIRQRAKEIAQQKPEIDLSRNGKNVVILMMDRAIGYYVPFIMQERPEVRDRFRGFTFYPNTLSYANKTNGGIPSIYGGYEYTPAMLNKRDDVLLADKHNEALLMMPALFHEAGYDVTVIDPSYAGYTWTPDLHIYDDLPYVHAFLMDGMFTTSEYSEAVINSRERAFFCFSIYKTSPLFLQPTLYTGGLYNNPDALAGNTNFFATSQKTDGRYKGSGIKSTFNQSVSSLINLPNVTVINDSDINTYTTMDNSTTHEPQLLQLPDYTISPQVDNTPFESDPITRTSLLGETIHMGTTNQIKHYHVNMKAFMLLGEWMDHLRENGVYDNTRIIIVSDHGQEQGYAKFKFGNKVFEDILLFNPVLLVKDFGDDQEFTIDDRFMTNADVPTLAMKGIITDPVNPATGNPVTDEMKSEPVHEVEKILQFRTSVNNGYTFLPTEWYGLHGNDIFNTENWEVLGIR